jgi:hypothetical protein
MDSSGWNPANLLFAFCVPGIQVALKLIRPQTGAAETEIFWRHVDVEDRGRVDIEQFCQRMATPPKELDWEASVIEDVLWVLIACVPYCSIAVLRF